jgi:hypothetical protein
MCVCVCVGSFVKMAIRSSIIFSCGGYKYTHKHAATLINVAEVSGIAQAAIKATYAFKDYGS